MVSPHQIEFTMTLLKHVYPRKTSGGGHKRLFDTGWIHFSTRLDDSTITTIIRFRKKRNIALQYYLASSVIAPATTGDATLVPDKERHDPWIDEPRTAEP